MRRQTKTEVEITIDALGFEGIAVGRIDGVVHFVKGGLPGERVRMEVLKSKRRHHEGKVIEVLDPSPERRRPPCPHFGVCGGCSWQHLDYGAQLIWKRQHVVDAFSRIGKLEGFPIYETLACPTEFGYRNKMEYSFGASRWLTDDQIASDEVFDTSFALGLHVPGRFDKVLNVERCMLPNDVSAQILSHSHEICNRFGVSAYNQREHTGCMRHLVVRTSTTTGSVLTVIVTTTPTSDNEHQAIDAWFGLASSLPSGSTMAHAINDSWSPVATGTIARMDGSGYLDETSLGVTYRISPFSFFQTNTHQLPTLVGKALSLAAITTESTVWDLYCGTGTLSLPAARRAKRVIGVELAESSIADARANANRNSIDNAEFHVADLHSPKATSLLDAFPSPDVILVDPPRAGMHTMLVEHLLRINAPIIVYVSCNPSTQARDCALLSEAYDVMEVHPVDMFPQTYHVESVALLKRR
ncbi:MAG: 23S rRNA (uracil(1939)-C(5))-methyltransferase RlmD [Candidatus Kapabacteria bacterium]|nr:23S rRNA (uracil(1939)-C(5))-methyltransferase RlmD [Candidatus Kapabacteria bacterium]